MLLKNFFFLEFKIYLYGSNCLCFKGKVGKTSYGNDILNVALYFSEHLVYLLLSIGLFLRIASNNFIFYLTHASNGSSNNIFVESCHYHFPHFSC
jgi:hypothetical protein